jgi:uncharacterized protein
MSGTVHGGELEVQRRAGLIERTQRHPGGMALGVRRFLAARQIAVLATLDGDGRVWASMRTGAPGFMRARDETVLEIAGEGHPDDPLAANLASPSMAGLLAIDLGARQRVRVNGTAHIQPDDRIVLVTEEVYGNCPKYIRPRHVVGTRAVRPGVARVTDRLDARHETWLAEADTFFLATALPGVGADASHRGGHAGFIQVADDRRVVFPDYRGNNYFNSLGNVASYPRAGVLVPNFASGAALQLTGVAAIRWDDPLQARFPGAQRLVEITIERVIELPEAVALRFGADSATPEDR